jgi:preprotein translocase subunit SecG
MSIDTILQIVMIAAGVLMVVSILLQQRGATLGAGFGSSGELYTTRRGIDKNLFEVTVIFAVIFVLAILAGLLIPS